MHGKRLWLRPVSAFFVAATMGLLAWGILGGGLTPGTRDSVVRREPTGAPPAVMVPSTIPSADSGRWCDEGLGCNDA